MSIDALKSRILQDIGEASMCWVPYPAGVFDDQRAAKIGEALADDITGLLETAWIIIANANHGDWTTATLDWQEAAARWRDDYHATLEGGSNEHIETA